MSHNVPCSTTEMTCNFTPSYSCFKAGYMNMRDRVLIMFLVFVLFIIMKPFSFLPHV